MSGTILVVDDERTLARAVKLFLQESGYEAEVAANGEEARLIRAQHPDDYAGKTLRLNDDGSVPEDNPFADDEGYNPEIYTLGHRNQLGLAVNPWTNELWASEQGPNGPLDRHRAGCRGRSRWKRSPCRGGDGRADRALARSSRPPRPSSPPAD